MLVKAFSFYTFETFLLLIKKKKKEYHKKLDIFYKDVLKDISRGHLAEMVPLLCSQYKHVTGLAEGNILKDNL